MTDVLLAVAGAHLTGQPLVHQLTDRGARLVGTTRLAAHYRLVALRTDPPKPGVVRTAAPVEGPGIEVEVWSLTEAAFGSFVAALPQPMAIGQVDLADGRRVCGFLVEPCAVDGALDITASGGWRAHLARAGNVARRD